MIDHVKVGVSDVQKAKEYYAKALAPLGYSIHFEAEGMAYFADTAGLDFGVGATDSPGSTHVGFTVADVDAVRAFYEAALAAGGVDNGAARASSRVRHGLLRGLRSRPRSVKLLSNTVIWTSPDVNPLLAAAYA
jgi:catechol 2,3-dioxygenase-like lactoylglutathione lyase family enzyme